MRKITKVVIAERYDFLGHRTTKPDPRSRFEFAQCLEQIIFALVCQPWYLIMAGKIGIVADTTVMCRGQRTPLVEPRRIRGGW